MKQINNNLWHVCNLKGDVLKDDVRVGSYLAAEDYIKRYVSSFLCYNYVMKPLRRNNGTCKED